MAKVLQRLVRRGLLASQQGTRGGYQLARPPSQISVADVIQAIDGPVTVTACSTDDDQLRAVLRSATCAIRCGAIANGFWRRSASARSRSWRWTRSPCRRAQAHPRCCTRICRRSGRRGSVGAQSDTPRQT